MSTDKRPEKASSGTVLLLDVLAAWRAVENDHGIKMDLRCSRKEMGDRDALDARFVVVETPGSAASELDIVAYWSWPTVHHKTFLGLLLWLIHQVDTEVTAQRALAGRKVSTGV